ncbi:PorV/PorQ family protein [bacterium]|nr:PorV/PorQ family protein [bacterium]
MRKIERFMIISVLLVGMLLPGVLLAEEFAKVGTVGSQFLKIPVGARGAAMGHAFSSVSDDATAMFWNPAGLTKTDKTNVTLEQVNWIAEISYSAVGMSHRLNNSMVVGLFATSLNSGNIEVTTIDQPDGTGETYAVTDMMVGASASTALTNKFSIGANIKYVHEDFDGDAADAWAIDVGTLYDTGWKTVRLSMNIFNFGPEVQLGGQYNDWDNGNQVAGMSDFLPYHFPMTFKMGMAADPWITNEHRLTLVAELEHPNDNIERYNVGGEYGFMEMFFLRGGYTFRHDTLGMSAGLGANWNGFGIDYAYSDFGVLDFVQRFNISFNF